MGIFLEYLDIKHIFSKTLYRHRQKDYIVDIAFKPTYILYIPRKEALERCSPHNSRVFLHVQKRKSYIIKSHNYVK